MNYKYTSDGKKVVVIGNLNSQETIVQEVFLSNNQEIPSGENFVVKSLHDAPVISWAEKNLKDISERTEKLKAEYKRIEEELCNKRKRVRELGETLDIQIKWMKGFAKNINEDSFNRLSMFISGRVKYMVSFKYDLEILEFDKFMTNEYGMKLLTMFGKDDGTMQFAVGRYSDGSGSWADAFVEPTETYEEAVALLQECLDKRIAKAGNVGDYDVKAANKYGLKIDKEMLKQYYEKSIASLEKQRNERVADAAKSQDEINTINAILATLND